MRGRLELIRRIKDGDFSAFEEWMSIHSTAIERFALQFGCSQKLAAKIAEETFKTVFRQQESIEFGDPTNSILYEITLDKLRDITIETHRTGRDFCV